MRLEAKSILAGYGKKIVLEDLSFSVPEGSIVSILGANGSGKTTLLKILGRLSEPRGGAVLLDGTDIFRLDTLALARKMAILPQQHAPIGELSVEELVAFGRFPHSRSGFGLTVADHAAIDYAIRQTRLESLRCRGVGTLSGGERQRAWLAMTLAQEPKLLLLDEPTTFLDIGCQLEIMELLRRWNRETRVTIVMVLHDLNLAASCSNLLIFMKDRKIRRMGTPDEMLKPEILRDIFQIETEMIARPGQVPYCIAKSYVTEDNEAQK